MFTHALWGGRRDTVMDTQLDEDRMVEIADVLRIDPHVLVDIEPGAEIQVTKEDRNEYATGIVIDIITDGDVSDDIECQQAESRYGFFHMLVTDATYIIVWRETTDLRDPRRATKVSIDRVYITADVNPNELQAELPDIL